MGMALALLVAVMVVGTVGYVVLGFGWGVGVVVASGAGDR